MIKIETIAVKPGSFRMGRNHRIYSDEPEVDMTLTRPFAMMAAPVTQRQWRAVMKQEPWSAVRDSQGFREGPNFPAVGVTWHEANNFAQEVSRLTKKNYRLPTEVEWEYCLRAGTRTTFFWGDDESDFNGYAWCYTSFGDDDAHISEVESLKPNPWGFYDLAGNVQEWVLDLCRRERLSVKINTDHFSNVCSDFVSLQGWSGIIRNGSFLSSPDDMRSSSRDPWDLSTRAVSVGFRLVLDVSNAVPLEKLTVLNAPYPAQTTLLSIMVFKDLQEDSIPTSAKARIRVFEKYLLQIKKLRRSAATEFEQNLLRDMLAPVNLKMMIEYAKGFKKGVLRYMPDSMTKKDMKRLDVVIQDLEKSLKSK